MKLSNADRQLLRFALHTAIESEEGYIVAHMVGYDRAGNAAIPDDFKPLVAKTRRTIARMKRMYARLDESKATT